MASNTIVQARIDPVTKAQASAVLDGLGLTISDAVRILLTRIAKEGALPMGFTSDPVAYDAWFRGMVQQALDDTRPAVADDMVEAQFAAHRSRALGAIKATTRS